MPRVPAALGAVGLRDLQGIIKPGAEQLTAADLRCWMRVWGLSVHDAAQALNVSMAAVNRALEAPEALPLDLAQRLQIAWTEGKMRALGPAPKRGRRLSYTASTAMVEVELHVDRQRSALRDAHTHGLNPRDLSYFRWAPAWLPSEARAERSNLVACTVVHVGSGCRAEASHLLTFALNRAVAEARLAKKLGQWAQEPCDRSPPR